MAQSEKITLLKKLKYELVPNFGVFIFILFFVVMVANYSHAASYTITLTDEQDNYFQKYVALRNGDNKAKDYRSIDIAPQDYLQNEINNLIAGYKRTYMDRLKEIGFIKLDKLSASDQEKILKNLGN